MDGIDWTPFLIAFAIGAGVAILRNRSQPTSNTPSQIRGY